MVFPAPVPPTTATRSPVSMRSDTPRSAQAACRPLGGRACSPAPAPGYANQTSRNSRAGGPRPRSAPGRRRPRPAARRGRPPPVSGGVSRSAKTRSAETVAACMTENFAEASRMGR